VTPFGELIATASRGTLMGNRGCLHDSEQRIRRPFVGRRWIVCLLDFKGRHRAVMAPGRYTELFFLDEATALAAGHRSCAECQRGRYQAFVEHWRAANRGGPAMPSADDIDRVLHAERLDDGRRKRTYTEEASRLPAGVMVADATGQALLVHRDGWLPWTPGGYGGPLPAPPAAMLRVLTPPYVVCAIAHGYPVEVHASAPR
jgi:hypothetical protein